MQIFRRFTHSKQVVATRDCANYVSSLGTWKSRINLGNGLRFLYRNEGDLRMNTKRICAIIRVSALLVLIVPVWAGAQDMLMMCTTCHGEDGLGISSDIPIIAGVPATIQEDALFAYADGARTCGPSPMMCKLASNLTEEQVVELAAHFAELSYQPGGEEFDAALAEAGQKIHESSCAICHGANPSEANVTLGASILHGQHKNFMRFALQQYAAGEREQLPAMEKTMSALSADDIEALVNYYASYSE